MEAFSLPPGTATARPIKYLIYISFSYDTSRDIFALFLFDRVTT